MLCHTGLMAALLPGGTSRPESIGYVDSEVVPARCHWADEDVAFKCEVVLESVALAWEVQVDTLGFSAPYPDSDGILDLYLTTEDTYGGAWTWGPYEDRETGDDRMGTAAYIALSPGLTEEELPVFVVHEFQHVTQYATDFTEPSLPIWEAVATAAEPWTLPEVEVTGYQVVDFQKDPWMGMLGDSYRLDYWSEYEYGAALWIMKMEQDFGDGAGSSGVALWAEAAQEGWTNEPDVVDAYNIITGDWRAHWMELSVERAWMGTELAPDILPYLDRAQFELVWDTELEAAGLPLEVEPVNPPLPTGISYFKLSGLLAGEELELSVRSSEDVQWGLLAVEGEAVTSAMEGPLTVVGGGGDLIIGVVHLGDADFDADRRVVPTDFTLSLARTAEVAGDSGGVEEDSDVEEQEEGGGGTMKGGGCQSAGGSALAGLALSALSAVLGRRRRAR
jgi:uncharacterized protein (TIGR03382 family)